jgi:hypothetical protein
MQADIAFSGSMGLQKQFDKLHPHKQILLINRKITIMTFRNFLSKQM